MDKIMLFESFLDSINEAEKGLMRKLLEIPAKKNISDVYKSGHDLARDLLTAIKRKKMVPAKDIRRKATSMLAFAANWPSEGKNTVIDKALKEIPKMEIPGVPISDK